MPEPLLTVQNLDAFYGDLQALFGVSMEVRAGQAVAVIGANGAGKSTLLKCIAGLIRSPAPSCLRTHRSAACGPTRWRRAASRWCPKGAGSLPRSRSRRTCWSAVSLGGPAWTLARVYELFPVLPERRHLASMQLSAASSRSAAIGRALMSNPKLLLCDEISLGLAPIVVRDIYARLPTILAQGTSLMLVEQDVVQALKATQRVYCLQEGRVALAGAAKRLDQRGDRRRLFRSVNFPPRAASRLGIGAGP